MESSLKAQTELLLIELLWGFDILTSSPMRLWTGSFEGWTRRNRLARRVASLESGGWVETARGPNLERVVRLTDAGRFAALGGRDPIAWWNRQWDHLWRIVLYDIPVDQRALRLSLRRELKKLNLGRIQGSAWLSPDPSNRLREILAGSPIDPRSLVIFTGRPDGGETDRDLVRHAWDFEAINRNYQHYLDHIRTANPSERLTAEWREKEAMLWFLAVRADPLLPRALWPEGYLGEQALLARAQLFRASRS